MRNTEFDACDVELLGALAGLLMQAGRDRAADAIYAAMEAETPVGMTLRPALTLVHSSD